MFINIIINLVRVKFMAILLGPLGIGIFGILTSIFMLSSTVTEMGIFMSSVREISFHRGKENKSIVNELIRLMRRLPFVIGLVVIVLLVIFSGPISQLSFGDSDMQLDVLLLGFAIYMSYVARGNQTLMQAFQFTGNLARYQVFSALVTSIISVLLYYLLKNEGIIVAILVSNLIMMLFSYFFSRGIRSKQSDVSKEKRWEIIKKVYKLGFAFMLDGIILAAFPYVLRVLLLELYDIETIGIFVAATAITRQVVQLILNTIKMDFYPRVSKHADDPSQLNQIINDQIQISILLGLPVSLFLIVFAKHAIILAYSSAFLAATPLIFWLTAGCFFQIIQWPLAFVFMAKSKGKIFININFWIYFVLHLLLTYVFNHLFGFVGIAIAFCVTTLILLLVTYILLKRFIPFSWNSINKKLLSISIVSFLIIYVLTFQSNLIGLILAFIYAVFVGLYVLRSIVDTLKDLPRFNQLVKKLPSFLQKIIFYNKK